MMQLNDQEKRVLERKYEIARKSNFLKPAIGLISFFVIFALIPAKYLSFLPSRKRNLVRDTTTDMSESVAEFFGMQNFMVIFAGVALLIIIGVIMDSKTWRLKKDLQDLTKSEFSGVVTEVIKQEKVVTLKGDVKVLDFGRRSLPNWRAGQKVRYIGYTHSKELIDILSVSDDLYCLECDQQNSMNAQRCSKCQIVL